MSSSHTLYIPPVAARESQLRSVLLRAPSNYSSTHAMMTYHDTILFAHRHSYSPCVRSQTLSLPPILWRGNLLFWGSFSVSCSAFLPLPSTGDRSMDPGLTLPCTKYISCCWFYFGFLGSSSALVVPFPTTPLKARKTIMRRCASCRSGPETRWGGAASSSSTWARPSCSTVASIR